VFLVLDFLLEVFLLGLVDVVEELYVLFLDERLYHFEGLLLDIEAFGLETFVEHQVYAYLEFAVGVLVVVDHDFVDQSEGFDDEMGRQFLDSFLLFRETQQSVQERVGLNLTVRQQEIDEFQTGVSVLSPVILEFPEQFLNPQTDVVTDDIEFLHFLENLFEREEELGLKHNHVVTDEHNNILELFEEHSFVQTDLLEVDGG